jgi:folate-binding protein YgfZ
VAGPDAAIFLQGQFTNELRGLETGRAVYGLWLTVKGKVLADSFVLRGKEADEFWVGSYFSPAATIQERLEAFIIADDVTVEDQTGQWTGVSIVGQGARAPHAGEAFVFSGRRTRGENVEIVCRGDVADCEGLPEIGSEELARLRIEAGIPAVPMDVGPGDLPNEAGLDEEAISYTKGCYLGQEVMARLKSMGQVRRRLLRVRGESALPPQLPAPLFVGRKQAGELRSAVPDGAGGFVGLAMLSLLHISDPAAVLAWADGAPACRSIERP